LVHRGWKKNSRQELKVQGGERDHQSLAFGNHKGWEGLKPAKGFVDWALETGSKKGLVDRGDLLVGKTWVKGPRIEKELGKAGGCPMIFIQSDMIRKRQGTLRERGGKSFQKGEKSYLGKQKSMGTVSEGKILSVPGKKVVSHNGKGAGTKKFHFTTLGPWEQKKHGGTSEREKYRNGLGVAKGKKEKSKKRGS